MPILIALLIQLSLGDIDRLARYDAISGKPQVEQAMIDSIRADFAGRGPEIVEHFLKHTDPPPYNSTYFLVFEAIADVPTALALIKALPEPPAVESGILPRDAGEVSVAIEAVLKNGRVQSDPQVVKAIEDAVSAVRLRPHSVGIGEAGLVVTLLGKCRGPEAMQALQRFASDAEPSIRELAVGALGEIGAGSIHDAAVSASMVRTLAHALQSDPEPATRIRAASSLARIGTPEGIDVLRSALQDEQEPRVVDAIVMALEELNSPVMNPDQCLELIGRCYEPRAAGPLFDRWRESTDRQTVLESAMSGPPLLRALALHSLVGTPGRGEITLYMKREPTPPVDFDETTREKLLASAVEVLSQKNLAYTAVGAVQEVLWELSGKTMEKVLEYADMLVPVKSRYRASEALERNDRAAYDDYRRPRQALMALLLAVPASLLLIPRRFRRAGIALAVSMLGWGVWSLFTSGVRELPPPPLEFLTSSFIGFAAGGSVSAVLALLPWKIPSSRWLQGVFRSVLAAVTSGVVAFIVCFWTRKQGLFPTGGEGWELLFDPLGSLLTALIVAFVVSWLVALLPARLDSVKREI